MNDSSNNSSKNASNNSPSNLQPIDGLVDFLLDSDYSANSNTSADMVEDRHELAEEVSEIADTQPNPDELTAELENTEKDRFDCSEIETDVEEPKAKITLEAAVEYEAFLRQTIEPKIEEYPIFKQSDNGSIEQYDVALNIDTESASSTELVDCVNTLIPLIVELLKYKIDNSQESIFEAVAPTVERLIERRASEEPEKMAAAISSILPAAITEKINLNPKTIAKAIAPEIALAIEEQILLDEKVMAQVLGPEMGKAIKTQIELEKDAMVDALYPVIGDTISKYMVEVVKEINSKVENTLSPEGLKRKFQARLQGVSEAELILQEAIGCYIQAVFLIDKNSGIVIEKVQKTGEQELDSDMVAGMLTAIRSFANDCIVSDSELDSIDYGNWQIHLEVAGYCYLAVVVKGEPNQDFLQKVRSTFGEIVLNHGEAIEQFDGDYETVPIVIKAKLEQLIEPENVLRSKSTEKSGSPLILLCLLALILSIFFVPWAIVSYRSKIARNIEQFTAVQLDAAPELSVYRLDPKVEKGKLIVTGRVPSNYLRDRATVITQEIAQHNNLQLDNRIIAVDVPTDPSLILGEVKRLTKLFNQHSEVSIESNYQSGTLSISGFILDKFQQENVADAFDQVPGIDQIILNVAEQLPIIQESIYFEIGSKNLNFTNNSSKIKSVSAFLNRYPQLHLKLVVYSDGQGSKIINQKLAQERCSKVKSALVAQGVAPTRVISEGKEYRIAANPNLRSSRYVGFEPFIPTQ